MPEAPGWPQRRRRLRGALHHVEGVLGDRNQPLPIHLAPQFQIREQRRLPPAIGYPIPVREDGTVVAVRAFW